jgi:uncharacterized repeat protein (TIGR01451 family)
MQQTPQSRRRTGFFLLSLALAISVLALFTSLLYAQEQGTPEVPGRDFSFRWPTEAHLEGTKYVNRAEAPAGAQLHYTLVISNSGESNIMSIAVTDTLPAGLSYVEGSFVAPEFTGYGVAGNVITWTAVVLPANSQVVLEYEAVLDENLEAGTSITNDMVAIGSGQIITSSAATMIVSQADSGPIYLPFVAYNEIPVAPDVSASATLPDSQNRWTLSWTVAGGGVDDLTAIEVHESQSPSFDSYTTINLGADARSREIQHAAGPDNVYYYRVAAVGPWGDALSGAVTVIGNYYDDFSDDQTGWRLRRASLLERMHAYYSNEGGDDVFIALVDDRWDWLLASPLRPAPALPYAIEYRARVHDAANLVSGGAAYGGNWNGGACPELGVPTFFTTENCFTKFYLHNYIFYGPLKLQWEKVNYLEYCPDCGGSALKRMADLYVIDDIIEHGPSLDWNTYRIEVRSNGASLFINGEFQYHFGDADYVHQPYFGVFASTFEYKPAIWFFDWLRVTRLD